MTDNTSAEINNNNTESSTVSDSTTTISSPPNQETLIQSIDTLITELEESKQKLISQQRELLSDRSNQDHKDHNETTCSSKIATSSSSSSSSSSPVGSSSSSSSPNRHSDKNSSPERIDLPSAFSIPNDLINSLIQTQQTEKAVQIVQTLMVQVDQAIALLREKQQKFEQELQNPSSSSSQHEVTKHYDPSFFFPKHMGNLIKFDSQEGLSYLTPEAGALEIACSILWRIKSVKSWYPTHIYDGTGGLGGNTIGFLRAVWELYRDDVHLQRMTRVKMVELDKERFKCGSHNIKLFEKEERWENPKCVCCESFEGNFLPFWEKEAKSLSSKERSRTLIFFDPPWGNEDYSKHESIPDLYMMQEDGKSVSVKSLIEDMLRNDGVACVAVKVPYHFLEDSLALDGDLSVECIMMKKLKYVMVFKK